MKLRLVMSVELLVYHTYGHEVSYLLPWRLFDNLQMWIGVRSL
jgi:hypothetical protein